MFQVGGQEVDLRTALPAARSTAGLSQERLAHLLGVHERTVHTWEKGYFKPRIGIRPLVQQFLDDPLAFVAHQSAHLVPSNGEEAA